MTIWLIWSPNAWKSTLFNRLIRTYRAIITDIAGTTRDIIRHTADFDGIGEVSYLDSPGLDIDENELPYIERIIKESDCIVLVIDSKTWLNSKDEAMLQLVRRAGKISQMILFLNKVDTKPNADKLAMIVSEYAYLWLEHIVTGSAHHGKIEDLKRMMYAIMGGEEEPEFDEDGIIMDEDLSGFDDEEESEEELFDTDDIEYSEEEWVDEEEEEFDDKQYGFDRRKETREEDNARKDQPIKIAIVGRPNVGKSTLINHIMKMELSKVSAIPGTTLDYISSDVQIWEKTYTLYDTAGIRRKGSIHGLEKIAFDKTHGMLKYYQPTVLFLIDASEGVTQTDRSLMGHILKLHLPTLVVINKIDLLNSKQKKTLLTAVQEHFGFNDRMFTIGISAQSGLNVDKIRPIVEDLRKRSHQTLTTGQLNKIISNAFITKPPTFPHNKAVKIYYTTQVKVYPPVFMSFINKKKNVTKAFENRLDTILRHAGKRAWIPLQVLFRDKKMDEEGYAKHIQRRKTAIRERLKRTPAEKIVAKKKAIARAEQKRTMR